MCPQYPARSAQLKYRPKLDHIPSADQVDSCCLPEDYDSSDDPAALRTISHAVSKKRKGKTTAVEPKKIKKDVPATASAEARTDSPAASLKGTDPEDSSSSEHESGLSSSSTSSSSRSSRSSGVCA